MSKGLIEHLLESALNNIFDDEWLGRQGEKLTERKLKWGQFFGRKGKVLRNVYLPKDNGETTELDVIFITQKGILVFESKNYSGWIFGDEKSKNWTSMLPNRQKNSFYNPVLQNRTHLKWLRNFVGEEIPLFSIIVFSERCELKKIMLYSDDVKVIKRDATNVTIREIWDKNPDVISEEKIDELYDHLKELTNVDAAVKEAHIQNIERKYKGVSELATPSVTPIENVPVPELMCGDDLVSAPETLPPHERQNIAETEQICPQCGSKLVLRTAKKGGNAGNQFYGCSAFPRCRYTRNK